MTTALMQTGARPAQALSEWFDQLFGAMYSPFQRAWPTGAQGMLANVYDAGDTYQAIFLIPGIDPQTLQVSAMGSTISVAGSRQMAEPESGKAVWQEFGPADFNREIGLPMEVDPDGIEATFTNGVLLVIAPKAEHAKPRQVQVKM